MKDSLLKTPSCCTYLRFVFSFDHDKNAETIRYSREQPDPKILGIYRKDEAEAVLKSWTDDYEWWRHTFEACKNNEYDVDINQMIRKTIAPFLGHEEELKAFQKEFDLTVYLTLVPYLIAESDEPRQLLSLDKDIIAFLYESDIELDLDYYIL